MEEEGEENKEAEWREKPFCLCKWAGEGRSTGVEAGHLGPVNPASLLSHPLPPSHRLPLHTWPWQPHSLRLQYERLIGRRRQGRWGASSREAGETVSQNIHQQAVLAMESPPPPFHLKWAFQLSQSLITKTPSNSWSRFMRTKKLAPGAYERRGCACARAFKRQQG